MELETASGKETESEDEIVPVSVYVALGTRVALCDVHRGNFFLDTDHVAWLEGTWQLL